MTDARRAYYERNREKVLAASREWAKAHPEQLKEGKRRRYAERYRFARFGLTPEQYADLLTRQNNRCAICEVTEPGNSNWNIDHDHNTNEVRGLLCSGCNTALGHYEKRIRPLLSRFDSYLSKSKTPALTLVAKEKLGGY